MATQFSLGWKRQAHDPRDYHFMVPRRITANSPPMFSVEANMGENLDQSSLGSCGPNTSDECITFDQKVMNLAITGASRLYIYYNTRMLMQTLGQDSGVDNRTMLKALARYGYCPESLWPYDVNRYNDQPPQEAYNAGTLLAISNYAAVIQQLDQMKGCLVTGHPFIFGFDVYQQIMSDQAAHTGTLTDPGSFDTPIGGHDVSIIAYDDKGFGRIPGGAFKFRNHWRNQDGSWWGDNGCGYISYNYATSGHASDFWVINAVPGTPGPKPPPSPTPTPTPTPSPDIWGPVLALIQQLLSSIGASAVPILEAWVAKLPLPGFVIAAIDALLEQYLGKKVALNYRRN